jgi:hypothetical protein
VAWVRERTNRPSDRRLSAKLVPTFMDKGCHVVSVTDPYDRTLDFLNRNDNKSSIKLLQHKIWAPTPMKTGELVLISIFLTRKCNSNNNVFCVLHQVQ